MFLLFPQPPLKKCSKKKCSNMHTRLKIPVWRRTGPVLVPKPQAAQPPVKAKHRMHGRPARGNDCGRARNAIQRGGLERRGGRPEGRCPPTFSPGLTSRLEGPGPFLSRPTRWNMFLPMSMPIVAMASRQLVLRGGPASQFKRR